MRKLICMQLIPGNVREGKAIKLKYSPMFLRDCKAII